MKAKLYISSLKEPIELNEVEAKSAEVFINNASVAGDTVFSIEGIWSGKKKDMRYVLFENEVKDRFQRMKLSDNEMFYFEAEIAPFLTGGALTLGGEMRLLESRHLIKIFSHKPYNGKETVTDFNYALIAGKEKEYALFVEKLEAWKEQKGREERKKRAEIQYV